MTILDYKARLREIDRQRNSRLAETSVPWDRLAIICEVALARFDLVAYNVVVEGWRHLNPKAIEAHPEVQASLDQVVKMANGWVTPHLEVLGQIRATDAKAELELKLRSKQQACLALLELGQAKSLPLPDFDAFSREVCESPVRSRAHWWQSPSSLDLDKLIREADAALERSRAVIAMTSESTRSVLTVDHYEPGSQRSNSAVAAKIDEAEAPTSASGHRESKRRGSADRSKWRPQYRRVLESYEDECQAATCEVTVTSIFDAAGISRASNGYAALRGDPLRRSYWEQIKKVCEVDKPHLKKK